MQEHRIFHAASLMKVPVMVEIFRLIAEGSLTLDKHILIKNHFYSVADHSVYKIEEDTDVHTYKNIGKTLPIKDLIHQMITVSSNIATNLLFELIQLQDLDNTLKQLGVHNSNVLRGVEDLKAFEQNQNNTITSADIAVIFEHLLNSTCISESHDQSMIRILQDQKMNEMIPAGLPTGTNVAHKTGDITRIHHDAGIIYPAHGAPYVLAILIEGIENQNTSARLGASLSSTIYQIIRG